jgi:single-strand DNA-binding protein
MVLLRLLQLEQTMNNCVFIGRLTKKPELEVAGNTNVSKFSIAVSRKYKSQGELKEEVNFLDMVIWDKGAETLCQYFDKGDSIVLYTSAKQETWTDKASGGQRSKIVFRVEKFEFPPFARKKNEDSENSEPTNNEQPAGAPTQDEIPF